MISDGTNNYCGVFEIITDNDSVKRFTVLQCRILLMNMHL